MNPPIKCINVNWGIYSISVIPNNMLRLWKVIMGFFGHNLKWRAIQNKKYYGKRHNSTFMIYGCQFHDDNKRLIFNMYFLEIVYIPNMELEDFWSCILLMDCLQVINETHSQCNKASGKCFSSNSQKVRNVFLTESKNCMKWR